MKKLLLGMAVSFVAASGANAAWETGYDSTNATYGNGEMAFMAWDSVAGVSYVQDLGVRFNDLTSGAAFNNQSFTVDLSVFAGSDPTNVIWTLTAGSGDRKNAVNGNDYTQYGFITSAELGSAPVTTYTQSTVQTSMGANLNAVRTATGLFAGSYATQESATESTSFGPKYIAPTNIQNNYGINTWGDIGGQTMELWRYGFGVSSSTKILTNLGTATLAGSTLTFNDPAPAVPVPAAAWLFGSAILGLAGVARRREVQA